MPINNITQTISTIPPAGARGVDVQTVFVNKQEDFQDHLAGITVGELNALKDQLNSRIGEINSTTTTMTGYVDTASAGASTATTKASEAATSASGALTSRNQASTFATNSSNSATKANQWADNNYNVEVETSKYSAKHWSTVAQNTVASKVDKVTSTDNAIVRFNGTTGNVQNSNIAIDDSGNIGSGVETFNGFGGTGFKNLIINGNKQVNQRGLTITDNAYNYDNHYKVGNNWFNFIDGKNIISGETYTLSWVGAATAGYYIGTAGALTINAQTFTTIANGGTITPTITSNQILWIKFTSDATGSTYNKVQFELGTVPTPYEHRLYELEKSLVQSCYSGSSIYFSNNAVAGNSYGGITMLPVDMRNIPILTLINQVNINGTFGTIVINNSADYSIRGINFYAVASSTTNGAVYKAGVIADARPY